MPGAARRWAASPRVLLLVVLALLVVPLVVRVAGPGGSGPPSSTASATAPVGSGEPVVVTVDAGRPQQTMQGFGAYEKSLVYGTEDFLPPDVRSQALDTLYRQVRLNTGNLDGSELLESPGSYDQRQNDNGDPATINWRGFQAAGADGLKAKLLDAAQPLGLRDFYLGTRINTRWASPWLTALRAQNYDLFLDEAAEQVVATVTYWRRTLGITTSYLMLFNEPLSGNRELEGGQLSDVVELVKRVGGTLERDGFGRAKFVIGNEETEEASLRTASAVLSDPVARQYVGAIGYHTYPYGSGYSSVAKVLDGPGRGRVDRAGVDVRRQLLELGRRYGVPIWMTEVSDPQWDDARSFDALRARAIQIHDELTYADASLYQGMMSMWDSRSQADHFNGDDHLYRGDGHVVLIDLKTRAVTITGMGYAIGHYARWITPGQSVRLPADSSDPLVMVTAFRDTAAKRAAFVLVNNADTARSVRIELTGETVTGPVAGEQSTAAARWAPLPALVAGGTSITITVPPRSVTSLAGVYGG